MTVAEGGGIFVSYRRHETSHLAGRLYDRLVDRFGEAQVFIDVNTIEPGVDFAEEISRAVATCRVLLAIIGPDWLTTTDEQGHRRLDDPDDIVRLEIEAALARGVRVIPILAEGAVMPGPQDLPESLASLTRRNALLIRHESFRSDAERLVRAIERVSAAAPEPVITSVSPHTQDVRPSQDAVAEAAQQKPEIAQKDRAHATRLPAARNLRGDSDASKVPPRPVMRPKIDVDAETTLSSAAQRPFGYGPQIGLYGRTATLASMLLVFAGLAHATVSLYPTAQHPPDYALASMYLCRTVAAISIIVLRKYRLFAIALAFGLWWGILAHAISTFAWTVDSSMYRGTGGTLLAMDYLDFAGCAVGVIGFLLLSAVLVAYMAKMRVAGRDRVAVILLCAATLGLIARAIEVVTAGGNIANFSAAIMVVVAGAGVFWYAMQFGSNALTVATMFGWLIYCSLEEAGAVESWSSESSLARVCVVTVYVTVAFIAAVFMTIQIRGRSTKILVSR